MIITIRGERAGRKFLLRYDSERPERSFNKIKKLYAQGKLDVRDYGYWLWMQMEASIEYRRRLRECRDGSQQSL